MYNARRGSQSGAGSQEARRIASESASKHRERMVERAREIIARQAVSREGPSYETVFTKSASLGISRDSVEALSLIDEDDRTENLAGYISDNSRFDQDAAANTLLAASHINWHEMPDEQRATMIDYCGRILESMGLRVTEVES